MSTNSLRDFNYIKLLGHGSFSEVFQVTRFSDGKIYALKKVKLGPLPERERENALNEVRILASINHPHIIGYKEAFMDEEKDGSTQNLCLVMDFASEGDLLQKIQGFRKRQMFFTEEAVWRILVGTVAALHKLHQMNILHRDIKSANIFLETDGTALLGDLNVSKVAKEGMLYTQTGTPFYASPEVWNDSPYDSKSDIWSLGCVLYEVLCLQPPFVAENMNSLFEKVQKGTFPEMPGIYSKALQNLIKSMLRQKPEDRPSCVQILQSSEIKSALQIYELGPAYDQFIEPDSKSSKKFLTTKKNSRSPQSERSLLPQSLYSASQHIDVLLETIRVPKNLSNLRGRLPPANYRGKTTSVSPDMKFEMPSFETSQDGIAKLGSQPSEKLLKKKYSLVALKPKEQPISEDAEHIVKDSRSSRRVESRNTSQQRYTNQTQVHTLDSEPVPQKPINRVPNKISVAQVKESSKAAHRFQEERIERDKTVRKQLKIMHDVRRSSQDPLRDSTEKRLPPEFQKFGTTEEEVAQITRKKLPFDSQELLLKDSVYPDPKEVIRSKINNSVVDKIERPISMAFKAKKSVNPIKKGQIDLTVKVNEKLDEMQKNKKETLKRINDQISLPQIQSLQKRALTQLSTDTEQTLPELKLKNPIFSPNNAILHHIFEQRSSVSNTGNNPPLNIRPQNKVIQVFSPTPSNPGPYKYQPVQLKALVSPSQRSIPQPYVPYSSRNRQNSGKRFASKDAAKQKLGSYILPVQQKLPVTSRNYNSLTNDVMTTLDRIHNKLAYIERLEKQTESRNRQFSSLQQHEDTHKVANSALGNYTPRLSRLQQPTALNNVHNVSLIPEIGYAHLHVQNLISPTNAPTYHRSQFKH